MNSSIAVSPKGRALTQKRPKLSMTRDSSGSFPTTRKCAAPSLDAVSKAGRYERTSERGEPRVERLTGGLDAQRGDPGLAIDLEALAHHCLCPEEVGLEDEVVGDARERLVPAVVQPESLDLDGHLLVTRPLERIV